MYKNMKKISISSFLLLALLFTGCYRDLGNYDYTLDSMNKITSVTFSPSIEQGTGGFLIEVQQALDENDTRRRVEVYVEQSHFDNLDNLDFYWYRDYVDENGKAVKDTVCTRGYLEFDLPVAKEMAYRIFLQIYDRTTDLSYYEAFDLNTRPLFKNSLFVLHGNDGNRKLGNIEVIGSDTKIYTDVKSATKDNNHYEYAAGLCYSVFYNHAGGPVRGYYTKNLMVFAGNGETKCYDPHGMELKYTASQIFRPESENFLYRKTLQTGDYAIPKKYKVVLTDDGDVYIGNHVHSLYTPGSGCLDDPANQTDYKVTAAAITHNRFLMWDAKYDRFLYTSNESGGHGFAMDEAASLNSALRSKKPLLDASVDFQGLDESPVGKTAVLGYINYRNDYDNNNPYFIFKDEDTGSYYRYALKWKDVGAGEKAKPVQRSADSNSSEMKPAFEIVEERELKNLTPDDFSTITYNSWFTTENLFFAEGGTVYRYNVNGDRLAVYEAPEGYDVTKIKFRTEDASPYSDDLGLYMNIVMFDGVNGAVAEIKFTTSADVDTDYAPLFYDRDNEGKRWGEIKDVQFVHEYDMRKERL